MYLSSRKHTQRSTYGQEAVTGNKASHTNIPVVIQEQEQKPHVAGSFLYSRRVSQPSSISLAAVLNSSVLSLWSTLLTTISFFQLYGSLP